MSRILFIGDTHFNHKNIIEYTSRTRWFKPKDTMSMESEIIRRWNKVVKPQDIVYHLGDFAFGDQEEIKRLVKRLNGKIRLILGNHDKRKTPHWYDDLGFDAIYPYPIILDDWFIVSHEPIKYLTEKMPYINIHGHTHDEEYSNPQRFNACWEILGGFPIDFQVIKNKYSDLDSFNDASKVYVQDKERNAAMNYNEGYLQGFIDGSKNK